MKKNKQMSMASILCGAAVTLACAPACVVAEDPGGEGHAPGAGEEVASAAAALTDSQLSALVLGGAFPVTNRYRPAGGHAGIDFGSTGDGVTAVSSPVEGTLVANTSACGKVAIFDGSNTIIMAHMVDRTSLPVGSHVQVGAYLGRASRVEGSGCTATGAHLHMEIRTGNHPIMADPRRDNTATTRDPLAYGYGPFAPVALIAPADWASAASSPVTFSWAPSRGATSYRLQISAVNSFDGETCLGGCVYNAASGSTSRVVSLAPGSTYYWRVRAGNASTGQGGHWSPVRSLR